MSRPSRSPVRPVTTATTSDRRQAVVGQLAQQPVLALGEVVGELLDDVRRAVALRRRARRGARRGGAGRARRACAAGPSRRGRSRTAAARGAGGPTDRRTAAASPAIRSRFGPDPGRPVRPAIRTKTMARQGSVALTSSHRASSVARSAARRSMPRAAASASTPSKRRRNLAAAPRAASSASTWTWRATLTAATTRSPSSSAIALGVAAGDRLAQLGELLVDLGQRAVDVRPVEADLGRLARRGAGRRRAPAATGRRRRTPTCGPSPRA